jgi:hypothetical protein
VPADKPAAIAVLPAAMFKVGWKGLFLYGPDVSCALAGIGGLAALTGLLRAAKAALSLPGRHPSRQLPGPAETGDLAEPPW